LLLLLLVVVRIRRVGPRLRRTVARWITSKRLLGLLLMIRIWRLLRSSLLWRISRRSLLWRITVRPLAVTLLLRLLLLLLGIPVSTRQRVLRCLFLRTRFKNGS